MTPMPIERALTREDLIGLWAAEGYTIGAEIGVERGVFSEAICRGLPGVQLLCVDAWQTYSGYREHVTQAKLEGFYRDTLLRLQPYAATVRRGWSTAIAETVPDGSLDFCYIDANHTFEQVVADLAAWSPKVRRGGMLAGHDYGRASVGQVREAVQGWTAAHAITPWYVLTGDRSPSWFWRVA